MDGSPSFGAWLRQRRRALDLTRDELAQRVGYSVSTLRRIEADELRPSRELAEALGPQLDLTGDELAHFVDFARGVRAALPTLPPPVVPTSLVPALSPRPPSLPAPTTRLIGRERELAAVAGWLRGDETRLVTLTGPGGAGKTRLALQVAAHVADHFTDGVFFVDLSALTEVSRLVGAIAQALDIGELSGQALLDNLKAGLRSRHTLLVLDNFEQIAPAAPLLTELLTAAPRLSILVTSRVVLNLRGESVYPVPPLSVPDLPVNSATPVDGQADDFARHALQYEAVRLFVERAREARHDFTLSNADARAIAEICHRLDGLPLAIELAAARVKLLPPPVLLSRLSHRLSLLTGGPRDLPPRQRALRDTMAWSYDLLGPAEQTLFRRLAVFAGSFTLEAAEEVIRDGRLEMGDGRLDTGDSVSNFQSLIPRLPSPVSILEALEALVDNSLVRRVVTPAPGEDDDMVINPPRFILLETVREYALERLVGSREEEGVRQSHAEYMARLVETAATALRGPQQVAWLHRLEAEHDNVRAALRWATHSDHPLLLHLVSALGWFWIVRGYTSEGRAWVNTALDLNAETLPSPARARALEWAARFAGQQGDREVQRRHADACLAAWRVLGDKQGIAQALRYQAIALFDQGETLRRALLKESVLLYSEVGDDWGLADAWSGLADIATLHQDWDKAIALYERSLGLFRRIADRLGQGWGHRALGLVYLQQGNYGASLLHCETALAIFRVVGDKNNIASTLNLLGELARCEGDYEQAGGLYDESLGLFRELGFGRGVDLVQLNLGHVARRRGDTPRAALLFRETLLRARERGAIDDILTSLAGLGGLASVVIEDSPLTPAFGARLLGAVDALRVSLDSKMASADLVEFERDIATLRDQLGEALFTTEWQAGRAMTLELAVLSALAATGGPPPSIA